MPATTVDSREPMAKTSGPPRWFIFITAAFTLLILLMAVAETTLWTHYFIDQGEYLSIAGLIFVLLIGIHLHKKKRLWPSLPLVLPWLIYPVVTQGDQIIDNLNINQMRLVVHLILAVIFGAPVAILVQTIHRCFKFSRKGVVALTLALLLLEVWVAFQFLGSLMVITLAAMGLIFLSIVFFLPLGSGWFTWSEARARKLALNFLVIGVASSFVLYIVFKNRPGAYQGSPSAFQDPAQKDSLYAVDRISTTSTTAGAPNAELSEQARVILKGYGDALKTLLQGYYILDRNYNYAFHNALFLRHTSLLPDFRKRGLEQITQARAQANDSDARLERIRAMLPAGDAMTAFIDEIHSYVAFNMRRAAILEQMSGEFEKTQAGLQHATHVYEGEGKMLGVVLAQLLEKHRAVLQKSNFSPMTESFMSASHEVIEKYSNRIVGF